MPDDGEPLKRFGNLIKQAREKLEWTQEDLADAADVSRPTVNRYEQGKTKNPDPDTARAIFRALHLDPRRIPIVLGYVTAEEMGLPPDGPRSFDDLTETAIVILEDPDVSDAEKSEWVTYLRLRVELLRGKRQRAG